MTLTLPPTHEPNHAHAHAHCTLHVHVAWHVHVHVQVRLLIFSRVQTALGLMPTAVLGALMGTVTYAGYSTLDGSRASMYIFFVLAGVGTVGSTFTGASVTPFFSQASA